MQCARHVSGKEVKVLELHVTGLRGEKQTRTTQVRHGDSLGDSYERPPPRSVGAVTKVK